MSVTENKVRIGLARAFWALKTQDGKYEAPHEFEWPEEATISNGGSNDQTIYAGDAPRYKRGGVGSKEIQVQMTKFSRDFLKACCGQMAESETTGGISEVSNGGAKEFAFGVETTGDQGSIRTWYYGCTATTPVHSAKTNTDSINEDAETSTFTAVSTKCGDGKSRVSTTFEPGDAGYDAAFTKVPFQAD
ncbi:major tail protein [Atopobium fossor]|uniref:major tail protein n=1 Tax=Atopobium fossor TaxID=39487 RepID=UPI000411A978|nr:major tail protein [Atopobium fossor]